MSIAPCKSLNWITDPTTISYLLPRPRDGYLQVGSEITCYADGHPPPMLSLRLVQSLRPPKPLSEEELETLRQVGRIRNCATKTLSQWNSF
ncbi:unnamed protein product [Dicrocoelium dendriticum]|nr:unnamed protein product [Dicrocoelium dendriticum]